LTGRGIGEIGPAAAAARLGAPGVVFLDVREPGEHAVASIDGALLVPMREIPGRLSELDRSSEIVVFCHHGGRSAMVAQFLRGQGFDRVLNLTGGIDGWSLEVDPEVPRYR